MNIGFSTGSLAYGDFNLAIEMLRETPANVIELSALREKELEILIKYLDKLDLRQFGYVSFHAPSKILECSETELIDKLINVVERGIPIILHPDVIQDISLWKKFGSFLCIENMDKRKGVGRTSSDLEEIFNYLPEASFCFDVAHARQVDPTLTESFLMLKKFGHRLKQLHVSGIDSNSRHEALNFEALLAYRKVCANINPQTPIVLESVVKPSGINRELRYASFLFDNESFLKFINSYNLPINATTNKVTWLENVIS